MTQRTGKRAVLVAANQPIEIWERPVADPAPGEVLVRLTHGGVCGTDVHFWRGEVPLPGPVVLGHEGVGTVDALGAGVATDYAGTPLAVGDRVYWQPVAPCQRCYACTVLGDVSMCENAFAGVFGDAGGPTTASYCDYATLRAGLPFYRVPDDTPSDAVIALGCALPTMLQGIERLEGIRPGMSVVVQGCGPVGLAATLLAHLSEEVMEGPAVDHVVLGVHFEKADVRARVEHLAKVLRLEADAGAPAAFEHFAHAPWRQPAKPRKPALRRRR